MTPSQRYLRRYRTLLVLAAGLYVVTAAVTLMRARTGANTEIFPVFSWDLFSVVPNDVTDYGLRISEVDGQPLTSPKFLETLSIFDQRYSATVHMAIQELGAACERDDLERQSSLQRMLVNNHLGGSKRNVQYELVRRRFDVFERARTGRFRQLTPVVLADWTP